VNSAFFWGAQQVRSQPSWILASAGMTENPDLLPSR
jgi:hypothetical protein